MIQAELAEQLQSSVARLQQPLRVGGVSAGSADDGMDCSLSTFCSHMDILSALLSSPALSARTICRIAGREELAMGSCSV